MSERHSICPELMFSAHVEYIMTYYSIILLKCIFCLCKSYTVLYLILFLSHTYNSHSFCTIYLIRFKYSFYYYYYIYFFLSVTVFLNCLHTFSESMPHILRTLHTIQKNTQWAKTPQFSCKMKLYIQNNVISSQNGILFSNDTHTTIICIDIYKNQLNTDVLNVKHYDECKTLLLHSS